MENARTRGSLVLQATSENQTQSNERTQGEARLSQRNPAMFSVTTIDTSKEPTQAPSMQMHSSERFRVPDGSRIKSANSIGPSVGRIRPMKNNMMKNGNNQDLEIFSARNPDTVALADRHRRIQSTQVDKKPMSGDAYDYISEARPLGLGGNRASIVNSIDFQAGASGKTDPNL